jgi:hypothetical protein
MSPIILFAIGFFAGSGVMFIYHSFVVRDLEELVISAHKTANKAMDQLAEFIKAGEKI